MKAPEVSVIIPAYNEEKVLDALFARLYPALDGAGFSYEVVFVNDGSRDRTPAMLTAQFNQRPDVTRVVMFAGNFGQHRAILAGFEAARGAIIVTLDADLQNPPEEIPKLVARMKEGYDYVGTIRRKRQDTLFRSVASRAINWVRERTTRIRITDQGCMLRAYDRRVVDLVSRCQERNTFIPALAYSFAIKPVEMEVEHAARAAGESKYSLYQLIRLNFDLMTGFSLAPLQLVSMLGMAVSAASGVLVLILAGRRLVLGPEEGGLFTLFGIAFFMIGLALFSIGLVGEYVGRIYQEVQQRPRYVVATILERERTDAPK